MLQNLQDEINHRKLSQQSPRSQESPVREKLDSTKTPEKQHMIELEVFVRISYAGDSYRGLGENITVYLGPNIREEIEMIFGTVAQYVRNAIIELHSPGQMKIKGYDVTLSVLPSRVVIYQENHKYVKLPNLTSSLEITL